MKIFVFKVLNTSDLDSQQDMFKLALKSNATMCMAPPFDINPLIKMWHVVMTTSWVFVCSYFEYVKLVELAME